jgi:general secretion pathway protein K
MALLMTLAVISVMVASAVAINRKVRSKVIASLKTTDYLISLQTASSGVHAAMALLVKDKMDSESDHLKEDWSNQEKIIEMIGDIGLDTQSLEIVVSDERSKLQVNALLNNPHGHEFNVDQQILWNRFLQNILSQNTSVEEMETTAIIGSIKDWIDSGDDEAITGLNGAESAYYSALDPPYGCRNAPMEYIGEMLNVKGITEHLFYGTLKEPGIREFVTIYGKTEEKDTYYFDGKININTARLIVLEALLSPEDQGTAQAIFDFRDKIPAADAKQVFSDPTWYKDAPGCGDVEISPELMTIESDIYRIESSGISQNTKATIISIVRRMKTDGKYSCKIILNFI